MIRVRVDCSKKTVERQTLTLAEETALRAVTTAVQAKEDARLAEVAAQTAAKDALAKLDPKTATVEQLLTLMQAAQPASVKGLK